MRIRRLDLKAFGPFTDQCLKFHSEDPGLHIIFGRNEAGKSSSLRGLKALLYGFPKQCRDNHTHANAQLLVGGFLERDGGERLDFLRRKKNIADLRDPEDNPLAPDALSAFLLGFDAGVFESLYAIDHEVLVQGGKDLLAQKGEVGQALFAAGAGILSLQRILERFDAEADQLFSSRATTKPLNKALTEYKVLKKSVRASSLSSRDWKEHQNRLKEAEAARSRLQNQRSDKRLKQRRLERLKQAIPQLKLRENYQNALSALGKVRLLPEDFSERVQKVVQGRLDTLRQMDRTKARLKSLQQESVGIHLNQAQLDHAALIRSLNQRLGAYQKGMEDRPGLDARHRTCQSEASEWLRRVQPDLPLEKIGQLRPVLRRKKRVQTLSNGYEALVLQVSESQKNLQKNIREQEDIEKHLSHLPPEREIGPLAQSLKLAMRAGDLDEQIAVNREALEIEQKLCLNTLKRIGLWFGNLKDLSALFLPLPETVKGFEHHFDELGAIQTALKQTLNETGTKLCQVEQRLKTLSYAGEVPTEIELVERREKRQKGWQLIRRAWLGGEDIEDEAAVYDPASALPEAFEKQMQSADQLSDRLRREADRVAGFADLKSQSESLEKALEIDKKRDMALAETLKCAQSDWRKLWKKSGIEPLSPKEMSAWLTQIDKLRSRVDELEKKEHFLCEQRNSRELRSRALRTDLKQLGGGNIPQGESLAPLILISESVLETLRSNIQKRKQLEEKRTVAQKHYREYEDACLSASTVLQDWQLQWKGALEELQLGDGLSPAEASDILEDLQGCFDKLKEAGNFASRIKGIDRDTTAYEAEVKSLLKRVAPELLNQPIEHAVIQLHNMQEKANQALVLREKNQAEVAEIEEGIVGLESELKGYDLQMQQHIKEADCGNSENLNEAILKSKDFLLLRDKLSDAETTLLQLSEGEALENIIAQAEAVQAENLPDEIAAITREIEETLNPEIDRLSEEIGDERLTLRQMDGSAEAAEAAASAERVLAGIGRMANQYVRLKLASTLLHEEIDRYRSEHQDPVLKLASSYFSKLTMASFSEIRSDVNDKGVSILIGLRPDGGRLPVEAMSTGTRDQLYLALRLAIVQSRLKSSEAIPFIVDDILINFDDDRSRATLEALSDLGQKNQVILFTHHRQIVNDAGKVKGLGGIYVHELA